MSKSPSNEGSEESGIFELIKKVKYRNDGKSYDLILEYMKKYIEMFCRRFTIAGLSNDDIEQECLFALRYKAIDDFNPNRGTFKTFAVLCIKRHLFSIIKGNNQNKKKALNVSLSIDNPRKCDNSDELSLRNIIADDGMFIDELIEKREDDDIRQNKLMEKLSEFEKEVFVLYRQKYRYDEIVDVLRERGRDVDKKSIDNSAQRIRSKAKSIKWGKNTDNSDEE